MTLGFPLIRVGGTKLKFRAKPQNTGEHIIGYKLFFHQPIDLLTGGNIHKHDKTKTKDKTRKQKTKLEKQQKHI